MARIKFDGTFYDVEASLLNQVCSGYYYKKNVYTAMPQNTILQGVIRTKEGVIGICKLNQKDTIIRSVVFVLCLGLVASVLSYIQLSGVFVNYTANFNDKLTAIDGKVDVNIVNGDLPVELVIRGAGFATNPVKIEANEVVPYVNMYNVFTDYETEAELCFYVGRMKKEFVWPVIIYNGEQSSND
ncbi:MAG: hypothetical protein LBS29_05035 [Endomicrobium sp.]|jgi:hypothetical protein|nr:hypothetical protein [Endomicrobium sp.]